MSYSKPIHVGVQKIQCQPQQGAALVVALITLMVMTIFGLSGMKNALNDLYSTQGYSDYDYAFQSAETGLRLAEAIINSATSDTNATSLLTVANISVQSSDSSDYSDPDFWDGISFYSTQHRVKVVVELYQTVFDSLNISDPGEAIWYYKITSRGVDPNHASLIASDGEKGVVESAYSSTVVQSIYAKRYTE